MIPARTLFTLLLATIFVSACAGQSMPQPLASAARGTLRQIQASPESTGRQIYEGTVYSLDGRPSPLFRYERRVQTGDGGRLVSTHITRDPSGTVVVMQRAIHSAGYYLEQAETIQGQTGMVASVTVSGPQLTFTRSEGDRVSTAHEDIEEPVVAGPTMFGFILAHWDELRSGRTIPIRFVVLERMETLRFVLSNVKRADDKRTTILMRPTNLLVRLAVSPTYFEFDTATHRILGYSGRVPPLETVDGHLETLDARVDYDFSVPRFE